MYPSLMANHPDKRPANPNDLNTLVPSFDIEDDYFTISVYTEIMKSTMNIMQNSVTPTRTISNLQSDALFRQIEVPSVQFDKNLLAVQTDGDLFIGGTVEQNKKKLGFSLKCLTSRDAFLEVGIILSKNNQAMSLMFQRKCSNNHGCSVWFMKSL